MSKQIMEWESEGGSLLRRCTNCGRLFLDDTESSSKLCPDCEDDRSKNTIR